MEWINCKDRRPLRSNPYLVSILRKDKNGESVFNYVAYYETKTGDWHKYNPFEDKSVDEKPITHRVTGWIDNMSVYLG